MIDIGYIGWNPNFGLMPIPWFWIDSARLAILDDGIADDLRARFVLSFLTLPQHADMRPP